MTEIGENNLQANSNDDTLLLAHVVSVIAFLRFLIIVLFNFNANL